MTKSVDTIEGHRTVLEASRVMAEKEHGCLIVVSDGNPIGIITERDLIRKIVAEERRPSQVQVHEVMSSSLITIDPDASLRDAARLMIKYRIRRLPVMRDGKLVGMVTTSDFPKHLGKKGITEEILEAMARYPAPPHL